MLLNNSVSRRGMLVLSRAMSALSVVGLAAACEVPTKAPIVDVRWIVPSQSTRIAVANLLPGNVTVAADTSGFLIAVSPATTVTTRTLAQDCPSCVAANGQLAPKPAFTATVTMSTALPTDFSSATLASGSLQLVVTSGYNFDPLRPNPIAGAPNGFAVITISSAGAVIGKDSVNGATTALAPGTALTRNIPLAGVLNGGSPVAVSIALTSPAGEQVRIDASRSISVSATPLNLKVATATVAVANKSVSSTASIDLADVDSSIINRVQGGALLLTVVNPFTVTGTLTVRFVPSGGAPITKTIALAVGTTTPRIDFTQAELRGLLGHIVSVSYTGTVSSSGGSVSVSPRQAVVVTSRLQLDLEVGG